MKKNTHTATPTLHAETYGSGPPLVLLHGFLASSRYWSKISELASKNYTVIVIDLLGFGKSPKPRRSSYDYEAHIESINITLRQVGVTQPFVLVGHSMGALIALRYVASHEDRIRKLVLTNMPVLLGVAEVKQYIIGSSKINTLGLTPIIHRLAWGVFRTMTWLHVIPKNSKQRVTSSRQFVFQHTAISRFRSFRNVIMNAKTDVDLASINVRTTVLSGIQDQKMYIDNLMKNIQLSPQVVLENVEAGHYIPRVLPEKLIETLNRS